LLDALVFGIFEESEFSMIVQGTLFEICRAAVLGACLALFTLEHWMQEFSRHPCLPHPSSISFHLAAFPL